MRNSKADGEVALFFTGGTITMRPREKARGVVPGEDFERFLAEIQPHIRDVRIQAIRWADLPSPHMSPGHMFKLARDIDQKLREPGITGAVVIHGTDVLVESAYMAYLTVRSHKPIVYTGSMRYYKEAGYDGIRNLLNSIKACTLPLPPETGVVVLMTDRIFGARDVIKINSLNIDAFAAPERGLIGYVAGDEILLINPLPVAGNPLTPLIKTAQIEPNVPLIACYTGMDDYLVEKLMECGMQGLVLEAFGAGNVPPGLLPGIESAVAAGIPVVITTQCPEGGVWPIYAYPGGGADLQNRGAILAGRLSGAKARIKLMVALGATRNPANIRKLFALDI